MPRLTLAQASTIVDAGLAKGRALGLKPLAIAVFDDASVLRALKMEDGGTLMRPKIAEAKAYTAVAMGMATRALMDRAKNTPVFMTALGQLADGKIVTVPGGVVIRDAQGAMLGSVGVSGDTSDQDEVCAVAGIEAAGLKADTGV